VIVAPPFDAGAENVNVATPLPAAPDTPVGAPGAVMTDDDGVAGVD
jgi:hypothetical protein